MFALVAVRNTKSSFPVQEGFFVIPDASNYIPRLLNAVVSMNNFFRIIHQIKSFLASFK